MDAGGTFTDCTPIDQEGEVPTVKAPTTHEDVVERPAGAVGATLDVFEAPLDGGGSAPPKTTPAFSVPRMTA